MANEEEENMIEEMEEEEIKKPSFTREDFKLINFLIEDKSLPEDLKRLFWAFGSKVMSLTNLDEYSLKQEMRNWKDAKVTFLMSKPYYKTDYKTLLALSNFEAWYFATLRRSVGGTQRERFIIGAQITQRIGEKEEAPKGGIVSGVKRFLGMG